MATYTGRRQEDTEVWRVEVVTYQSGTGVTRRPLRHIPCHSPTGFSWGYGGSGPADLALAMLVDFLRERPPAKGWQDPRFDRWTVRSTAWKLHQAFKWHFVATFEDDWELDDTQIAAWLTEQEGRWQAR